MIALLRNQCCTIVNEVEVLQRVFLIVAQIIVWQHSFTIYALNEKQFLDLGQRQQVIYV
jgi:hypothetical protein